MSKETYTNFEKDEQDNLNGVYEYLASSRDLSTEEYEKMKQYVKYLNETVYPDGMPLIPKMESNECSVGKASAMKTSGSREAYKAFDRIHYFGDIVKYNDLDNSWQSTDNNESYIQFEFNRNVVINRVEFIPSYTSNYGGVPLKTAKLLLSKDGVNFTEVSDLKTYTNSIDSALAWQKIESNDQQNEYKDVRLYVNGSYTSSYGTGIAIREMQIYGYFK